MAGPTPPAADAAADVAALVAQVRRAELAEAYAGLRQLLQGVRTGATTAADADTFERAVVHNVDRLCALLEATGQVEPDTPPPPDPGELAGAEADLDEARHRATRLRELGADLPKNGFAAPREDDEADAACF